MPAPMTDRAAPDPDLRGELASLLPHLRAYARFLLRDPGPADDLVQETLLRAMAALPQFEIGTNLRAWAFTILRRTFLEQARRRRRESAALETHSHLQLAATPHPADLADLSRAVWTLPPALREALLLVGAEGLSHEEAASICGVAVGTMRARLTRARSLLASRLGTPMARPSDTDAES